VPLVVLAVAYIAVVAPLQVGSNLLVGIGRVRAVIQAAAAGLLLNLVLSLALIGPLGAEGVFVATLVSAIALVPLLGRAVLGAVDLGAGAFVRTAVLRPAAASAVLAGAVAVPVALPLAPVPTVVAGLLAAAAAYGWAAPTLAMGDGELRSLLRGLRRPTEALT
jgi:O-antigen/teichoic acid export membrane protein